MSILPVILLVAGPSHGQDQAAISPILDILRKDHLSGSLQYRGRCGKQDEYVTRGFPITTTPASNSEPSLQILREMFAKDPDMQVTQAPDGTIRMIDKSVPQDLLSVKIEHISFSDDPDTMGVPTIVLGFITAAPEVKVFMKDHGIALLAPRDIIDSTSPGAPHVSGELSNVTLSQALDYMAKTFHGLWLYKECSGNYENKRGVVFWFFRSGG